MAEKKINPEFKWASLEGRILEAAYKQYIETGRDNFLVADFLTGVNFLGISSGDFQKSLRRLKSLNYVVLAFFDGTLNVTNFGLTKLGLKICEERRLRNLQFAAGSDLTDIEFLEDFREKIDKYLFLGFAPPSGSPFENEADRKMQKALKNPEFQELRRVINEMKSRATQLLEVCGIGTLVMTEWFGRRNQANLFNLVTENTLFDPADKSFFFDRIDEAIGRLKTDPPKYWKADMGVLITNCRVTVISAQDSTEIVTNEKANIQREEGQPNSYKIFIDVPDREPEVGDTVIVSDIKLLSGEWKLWKQPKVNIGGPRAQKLNHVVLYAKRPKDLTAEEDKVIRQYINVHQYQGGTLQVGDSLHIEGGVHGSNVNFKVKMEKVTQAIGSIPTANQEQKDELTALVKQLNDELVKVPEDKAKEAEKIVGRLESLLEEAKADEPDKDEIETRGNSLRKAAEKLADAAPTILLLASQVASRFSNMA